MLGSTWMLPQRYNPAVIRVARGRTRAYGQGSRL